MTELPGTPERLAVIGAGAAGTLTAAQLLRCATRQHRALELWLIDPDEAGPGVAYRTEDRRHLLNVPAGAMSAFPDEPDHFLRWLAAWEPCPDPGEPHQGHHFLPRRTFGRYLSAVLAQALDQAPASVRLHRVRRRAVDLAAGPGAVVVTLAGGDRLPVHAAVLALGLRAPGQAWAPEVLRGHPGFVADPWAPDALAAVPDSGDVLLVGTGLTMADVAVSLARPGRTVHAVSRHGLAPHGHRVGSPAPVPPPWGAEEAGPVGEPGPVLDLDRLRRAVLRHIAVVRRERGDWRPAVDGLRTQVGALWQRLSPADRARFLGEDLRRWEVHRHRLAPATAATVQRLRTTGRLTLAAAEVVAVTPVDGREVLIRLSNGRWLTVATVVNCTGPSAELTDSRDPLHSALLAQGSAVAGPLGLGLATAADGRLTPAPGRPVAPLWALGVLRRGELLESTAIPEIRAQAAALAQRLLPDPGANAGEGRAGGAAACPADGAAGGAVVCDGAGAAVGDRAVATGVAESAGAAG
ncbi:FAD/NAD(P)-binding protein [Kitasatospora sp. LaBMicrA B282]|uniref:FAD/NAD(P)-binding protein n=1 Tax=Kitasatospora sp. LaBMicrA B282 TaxID=3420949 RepID=UPI003D101FF3